MRTPWRLAGAVLAGALLLAPTAASAETERGTAVGGPRLATDGVVVGSGAPALPDGITASSWLVADLDTGQVLAARDPHGRYAPASTLKTLTALALAPELAGTATVTPTYEDVAVEGSKVGLLEGVAYPVDELFSSLMMVSGNDSANALATAVGGQAEAAALMNATAARLGARDTRAVNPHGLDAEGQTSSAYDLALIARAGMQQPDFARWAVTRTGTMTGSGGTRFDIVNHNKLLASYEGALGIKNGYTSRARASFVGAAERDGRRLVVSLMRADPRVWAEAGRLLDWGFSASAAPVGVLVEPQAVAAAKADPEAASSATGAVLPAPAAATRDGGPSSPWLVALGGLALAVAAVRSVKHDPPARPVVARAPRPVPAPAPLPVHRPAPAAVPVGVRRTG